MQRNDKPAASLVGIRAVWTCALCGETEKSFQLVELAGGALLRLPAGWQLIEDSSLCSQHRRERDDRNG